MKSLIVAEIHDSLILDVTEEELEDVIYMAVHIMTELTRRHFPWITIPLEVEAKHSETNWHEMEVWELN